MNIKEHIEANHYPRDDKGRALVPHRHGGVFTVCATDKPPVMDQTHNCIAGWNQYGILDAYDATGCVNGNGPFLLPPPPRKVKVTAWGVFCRTTMQSNHHDRDQAERAARDWMSMWKDKAHVVELTGEYEEPWS